MTTETMVPPSPTVLPSTPRPAESWHNPDMSWCMQQFESKDDSYLNLEGPIDLRCLSARSLGEAKHN
jgi:hypothetical protein